MPLAVVAVAVAACGPQPSACVDEKLPAAAQVAALERSISQSSPQVAALATRYAPTVIMSALDGFWPVSVDTVLQERDSRGNGVVLYSDGRVIADPVQLADLKPSAAQSSYLDYPAVLGDKRAQIRAFLRGLGVSDAAVNAWPTDLSALAKQRVQVYFYDAGTHCSYPGHDTVGYRALQYWFFYGFNYYPITVSTRRMLANPLRTDTVDLDLHEGDWEHVTVLLSWQQSHYVPKFIWMARHSNEGKLIPWDQVQHDPPGHPVVYPAFGGHPSYPDCGAHPRALLAAAVFDYVVCGSGLYTFSGSTTRLVDLARVSWGCWPGHFGTTVGTKASSDADDPTGLILVAGPRSPLQQAENTGVCANSMNPTRK